MRLARGRGRAPAWREVKLEKFATETITEPAPEGATEPYSQDDKDAIVAFWDEAVPEASGLLDADTDG
jgi:hypothetical protein